MIPDLAKYVDLGGTVIVALMAFWAIVRVEQLRRNGNGNEDVLKAIRELEGNHLGEVNGKLDELLRSEGRIDSRLDEVVKLLIRIDAKLNKGRNNNGK